MPPTTRHEDGQGWAPLAGVRVLDLTDGIAGAVAGTFLGEYGADVVMVEPPEGRSVRSLPGFQVWGRNKRSHVPAASGPPLADLIDGADLCLCSRDRVQLDTFDRPAAELADLGAGRVVLCLPPTRPGFGWHSDEESAEMLAGTTGLARRQASFEGGPVDLVYPHTLYLQGIWGATCALAGLLARSRTSGGQLLTVDGVHAALLAGTPSFVFDERPDPGPEEPPGPGGPNPCYTLYRCGDEQWLFLGALTPKFQRRAFEILGLEDLVDGPPLHGDLGLVLDPRNRKHIKHAFADAFASRACDDWLKALEAGGCPAGPLGKRDDWLDHPFVEAVGMRAEVAADRPGCPRLTMPGVPIVIDGCQPKLRSRAPRLGEHTGEVDWTTPSLPWAGAPAGHDGEGPLAGFRVLDLGTILAGPLAGSLLSGLGADVIKVEPPGGDPFRDQGFVYNRGMRSIAIDLRHPAGGSLFRRLAQTSDAVIDNYRPSIRARLGADLAALRAVQPTMVTYSITGYGEAGPFVDKPGFDPLLQAASGMMSAQGGDDDPVFLTIAVNDIAAAAVGAFAIVLGLLRRCRTGRGQAASTSLASMATLMQSGEIIRPRQPAARLGGRDFKGPASHDRYYRVSDGWVRLQAPPWRLDQLVDLAAEHAELGPGSREGPRDADALLRHLSGQFSQMTAAQAVAELSGLGIACCAARRPSDLTSPELVTGTLHRHRRADGTAYFSPGPYVGLPRRREVGSPPQAPGLGEHTIEIMEDIGCETPAEVMVASGAVVAGGPLEIGRVVAYR